jgi:hypothetical protein
MKEKILDQNADLQAHNLKFQDYQDGGLKKLTKQQQIEVLKFAQTHQISPNDPTWLLVDMLGHVKFFTETLPNRIEAAADNAVEVINQQRLVEQTAFSSNAIKQLDVMLNLLIPKIAKESKILNDQQIIQRLIINSFMTIGWVSVLMATSVTCGYLIAQRDIYWSTQPDKPVINALSHIFNLPVGYIIFPSLLIALVLMIRGFWSFR